MDNLNSYRFEYKVTIHQIFHSKLLPRHIFLTILSGCALRSNSCDYMKLMAFPSDVLE